MRKPCQAISLAAVRAQGVLFSGAALDMMGVRRRSQATGRLSLLAATTAQHAAGPTTARRHQRGGTTMTMRPDPTFHASPRLAMEAPPENFAYTLLLSPDFSKPDALAVIDVKPGSPNFCRVVHTVTM